MCFVSDGKVDYLKTVSVAVLDCKQYVSFIVFHRVVYFMKRIYHFCCKFWIVNIFQEIFNPIFIMIKMHCSKRELAIDGTFICCISLRHFMPLKIHCYLIFV